MAGRMRPVGGFRLPLHLSRLRLGLLGQALGQVVQVGVRFVEVPLLLYFWGAERYGEWLVITAIPGLLALGDFGVSQSAVRAMTTANAAGDTDRALSTFQSAAAITFAFSLGFSAIFLGVFALNGAGGVIGLSAAFAADLLAILALLAGYMIVSMQSLLLFGVLQSVGRYPLGFALLAGARLLEFCAIAAAVALGGNAIAAAFAMLCAQLTSFTVMFVIARLRAPWMRPGLARIDVRTARSLLKPSLAFAAFPVAQGISLQAFRLIVGGVLGPYAVVVFVTHRQLARFLNSISNYTMSVQGELGLAFGAGEVERYRLLAVRSLRALLAIGSLAFLVMLVGAPWVYAHWTTGKVHYDAVLFSVLLVGSFAELLWRSAMAPAMAINRHEWIALAYLTVQILSIPVIFVAMRSGLDLVGAIVCGAEVAMLAFVLFEFRRLVGVPLTQLFKISLDDGRRRG